MTKLDFFLDWEPNCQFAGLIWAREKGLFAQAGLDVRLIPPHENPDTPTLDLVLGGGLCAGVMEDNLIVRAAAAGKSVRAIGATMQDSPIMLITAPDSGIGELGDLPGRRIAMHRDGIHLLETVLALHGIEAGSIETTVAGWNLDQLIDGTFDAVQGYTTTEPHTRARRGFATHLIPLRHHDLHPWAQMMFTSDAVIAEHPDALGRFVSACKQGWRQAMAEPGETAEMVAACSNEHDDPCENRHILDLMLPLIAGERGLDHCVTTDPDRWRRNLATYVHFGMIEREISYDAVVCDRFM
ncbi:MAG: ABC transporter substrate-binding protein [Rhodospirillaceae bacterium]|jgi:ABC-type nitrate/sulfonate/bicarbonate transport system substrate-binding protein|nr:ABC transporter substrate-binding protein [Rhodospirillaceae bacterium]MBT6202549.1 ABC transporter substrate-binding protein [Rhodospirillaceae bacterium]MBT7647796.1 ABC transporter substrate-binding protein [Rhodospirillaceae bacterium]